MLHCLFAASTKNRPVGVRRVKVMRWPKLAKDFTCGLAPWRQVQRSEGGKTMTTP